MTNTLHRLGDTGDRRGDFVIICTTSGDINRKGSARATRDFLKIVLKHGPVNIGNGADVPLPPGSREKYLDQIDDTTALSAVFDDQDKLKAALKDIVDADLGLCINVSGAENLVRECCHHAGIVRHSVESSLGITGQTDLLPSRTVLEIATMCGHGMVSSSLIAKILSLVKTERMSIESASQMLCRPCVCGVMNPTRTAALLRRLLVQNS